jgi:hypothetical protein
MKEEKVCAKIIGKNNKKEIIEVLNYSYGMVHCKRKNGEKFYLRLDEIEFLSNKKDSEKWNFDIIEKGSFSLKI